MTPRAKETGAALLAAMLVATVGAAAVLMSAFSANGAQRVREQRTLALLAQANDALTGFAATHGRLPRPSSAPNDGRERAMPCGGEDDCTGYLPWLDLGLPAADGWGRALRYSVTPVFSVAPLARTSAIATKRVQSRDASGALFFTVGQDVCTLPAPCAPAIVFSSGPVDALAPAGADEANNRTASVGFIRRPASTELAAPGEIGRASCRERVL